jgi:hypothetical protein
MVIDPKWEMIVSSVTIQLVNVATKSSVIAKICKYKGPHKWYHFILMAMEVHSALGHDMDRFIRKCACLFHNRKSRNHLFMSFCIQFFKHWVSIAFQCVLTSAIERKIGLVGDACFKPPIIIKSHNLCASDISNAVGEIASYHNRDYLSPFFLVLASCSSSSLSLAFPFCLPCDGSGHQSFILLFYFSGMNANGIVTKIYVFNPLKTTDKN